MGIRLQRGSGFEVDNLMDSSNLCDKVSITMAALDVERNPKKSLRQFTLSLLKPRMEVSEILVLDSVKG